MEAEAGERAEEAVAGRSSDTQLLSGPISLLVRFERHKKSFFSDFYFGDCNLFSSFRTI